MIPSLFTSDRSTQSWSLARAAVYGAGIGVVAALFKTLGPLHAPGIFVRSAGDPWSANAVEIAAAALVFALICVAAAALRNYLVRRLA